MIFVDSSVWIDYFRGTITPETDRLDAALGVEEVVVGDLVLTEVLQGFDRDADFDTALRLMQALPMVTVGGAEVAVAAARNYRALRKRGVTVRKTIDTLIATRCMMDGWELLASDRDFDVFSLKRPTVSAQR
jgi:predicted nucleic acid-binding protein